MFYFERNYILLYRKICWTINSSFIGAYRKYAIVMVTYPDETYKNARICQIWLYILWWLNWPIIMNAHEIKILLMVFVRLWSKVTLESLVHIRLRIKLSIFKSSFKDYQKEDSSYIFSHAIDNEDTHFMNLVHLVI